MFPTGKIEIEIPNHLGLLDFVQGLGEQLARLAGFDDAQVLDIGLALREGAINAIKHGNAMREDLRLGLSVEVTVDSMFRMAVRDQGAGFDPDTTPDPTDPQNIWRSNGRGLLLIRSLVDEVEFVRRDSGMELILAKRLPQPPAAGGEVS
jgi:serine/threonine-protein kinase RsbW